MLTQLKTCSRCKRNLPVGEFFRQASAVDGLQSRCKQCHKEGRKTSELRRWRTRQAELDAIKRAQGCVDCGTRDGALDFDHRPSEVKLFTIGSRWSYSWKVLNTEIAKCDVRCRSCHARRHAIAGDTFGMAA